MYLGECALNTGFFYHMLIPGLPENLGDLSNSNSPVPRNKKSGA